MRSIVPVIGTGVQLVHSLAHTLAPTVSCSSSADAEKLTIRTASAQADHAAHRRPLEGPYDIESPVLLLAVALERRRNSRILLPLLGLFLLFLHLCIFCALRRRVSTRLREANRVLALLSLQLIVGNLELIELVALDDAILVFVDGIENRFLDVAQLLRLVHDVRLDVLEQVIDSAAVMQMREQVL